jgi:hypothetical protein
MQNQKTVFVVGAGASYEYKLPTGQQLKQEISRKLSFDVDFNTLRRGDELIYHALWQAHNSNSAKFEINRSLQIAREVSVALPLATSIDNFIHIHKGDAVVELCGKLAIVRTILAAEASSSLHFALNQMLNFEQSKDAWLVRFMQLLNEDCNIDQLEERLSTMSFIVFNYDRCVEHFLFHAIKTYYRVDAVRAGEIVGSIRIFHPYGTVGTLPWMRRPDTSREIEFGGTPHAAQLLTLAQGIKTFTEGGDPESEDNRAMRICISEAQRIAYLGFAYHPLNLDLMRKVAEANETTVPKQIFGTAFGMSDSDVNDVSRDLVGMFSTSRIEVRNDMKCGDLFHEYNRSLRLN